MISSTSPRARVFGAFWSLTNFQRGDADGCGLTRVTVSRTVDAVTGVWELSLLYVLSTKKTESLFCFCRIWFYTSTQ